MKTIIIGLILTVNAMASDAGTATKELCTSKGMTFVKASVSKSTGKPKKAYCRKKAKKAERAVSSEALNMYELDLDDSEASELGVN